MVTQSKRPVPDMKLRRGALGALVGVGVLAVIALVVLFNSFTVVDAGTRGVVKTFGEVTGVLEEGLHFRTP